MLNVATSNKRHSAVLPLLLVCLLRIDPCTSFLSSFWSPLSESRRQNHLSTLNEQDMTSYFVIQPSQSSSRNDWKQLCPPWWNPKETNDVSLLWSCCDDTQKVATELLLQLNPAVKNSQMVMTIAESLEQFRAFCTTKLRSQNGHGTTFKARLVATRGSSGTKCPQWHVDHVPVRWIQSLVGPGCDMVVGNAKHGIEWNLVNGLNEKAADTVEMSVQERNDALVKVDVADIYSAKEMEAILLVGNRWNDYANKAESIPPVVHKSPTLPWGCERVLLTQDIIFDDTTMY